ncbi:MAG: hypothetical protein REI96_22860 [Flavobacterium nitrogenifigens]|uniref:hypothetical protein n=1 Tax=Flavobacterium nitrogenifigens TaxID=1617283 RepID=UPI00280901E9|nr:hypothetical protein [Flavobacterium nitrogenifigens]MDQ8015306.1 hypothetical protein [Flavobacterium nitrogenifigens]
MYLLIKFKIIKKIKIFAFSILCAALVTVGLYACSNDEANKPHQENIEQISNLQNKEDGSFEIGTVDKNGIPQFSIDKEKFASEILKDDLLAEIESIEIDDTYLTIIGKDKKDFSLVYFQAKLTKDGSTLYFPNPENSDLMTTFNTNTCAGSNCTGCTFKKQDGKIVGCDCSGTGDSSGDKVGYCNHSVTDEGLSVKIRKWVEVVLKALDFLKF